MAGKKQQAPKPVEEDEEVEEGWDNVAEVDTDAPEQAGGRMRDWRDVEKYREMRELRRLVGDDFDFTDVLGEIPIRNGQTASKKPDAGRAKVAIVATKARPAPAPAKPAAPPAKAAPQKPAPKPAHKPAARHAKPAKPAHKTVKKAAKPAPKKAKARKK